MNNNTHIFALYLESLTNRLTTQNENGLIVFEDKLFFNRLTQILRLKTDNKIVLFDSIHNVIGTINENSFAKKNSVALQIETIKKNAYATPPIHLYQGLTKKSTFEEIVYNAAQLGISSITPVITTKIHKSWFTTNDLTRLNAIMVSACEQAKQFALPQLSLPIEMIAIEKILDNKYTNLLLDPLGNSLISSIAPTATKCPGYNIFIGAEGGLTEQEAAYLKNLNFLPVKLGNSILRSQEATFLSLGIIRSL